MSFLILTRTSSNTTWRFLSISTTNWCWFIPSNSVRDLLKWVTILVLQECWSESRRTFLNSHRPPSTSWQQQLPNALKLDSNTLLINKLSFWLDLKILIKSHQNSRKRLKLLLENQLRLKMSRSHWLHALIVNSKFLSPNLTVQTAKTTFLSVLPPESTWPSPTGLSVQPVKCVPTTPTSRKCSKLIQSAQCVRPRSHPWPWKSVKTQAANSKPWWLWWKNQQARRMKIMKKNPATIICYELLPDIRSQKD